MAKKRPRGRPKHPDVLTPAEWRTVNAVRHGQSTAGIARRLGVSPDAVKFHITNAREKLALPDRHALRHWRGAPAGSPVHQRVQEHSMTAVASNLRLGEIGQIARNVTNIAAAEAFYRDVLGLPHLYTFGPLAFFDCGGTRLMLQAPVPGQNEVPGLQNDSVLYFRVADIHAMQDALMRRGATFKGAPHMIHRHADGAEEWMTFFSDPDGGLLALMAQVRPAVHEAPHV